MEWKCTNMSRYDNYYSKHFQERNNGYIVYYTARFLSFTSVTCSVLTDPENGTIMIAPDSNTQRLSLGSVATYSCNTGFALVGQTTRVCEDTNVGTVTTGTWSGSAPTCQGNNSPKTTL